MTIGTSDGQTFNTKWDQYSSQLGWTAGGDYDMASAKKAGVKPDPETGHMPDTYKMPNHITFSNESMYHGKDGEEGGQWNKLSDDRWSFTPGASNYKYHSRKELADYFKKYETGNVLADQEANTAVENGPIIKNNSQSKDDPRGMVPHIQSEAQRLGINPDIAVSVAKSEGLRNPTGDHGMSHGAFQLYTGGGLGNEFQTKTGLDPSDPKNEKEGITFALEHAAEHGWSAFHGAKNTGIDQWAGIPGDHIDIDRSHHVPLAASAKIDREGNPIGVSIHSGAPQMEDNIYDHGVAFHENIEAMAMKNLIRGGMDPYEAYQVAHEKFATPMESDFVKAERGEDFLENSYKPYWRNVAAMAKEQAESEEETNLGPQDHTSIYDLNRELKMRNAKIKKMKDRLEGK